ARPLAEQGWLVTFGISPDRPETGYGYIQAGDQLGDGVHRVARFVEKPDQARAEAMLVSGDHVWNAGIFLFRADAMLAALTEHAPEVL
ncbi:sugar phosphate nucleotidyltransferase, partial [Acinetobacter baumannii]